jgi:hypothetical protein
MKAAGSVARSGGREGDISATLDRLNEVTAATPYSLDVVIARSFRETGGIRATGTTLLVP